MNAYEHDLILDRAKSRDINLIELDTEQLNTIRRKIASRYRQDTWEEERQRDDVLFLPEHVTSIRDIDLGGFWLWIMEFVWVQTDVIAFFRYPLKGNGYRFESGEDAFDCLTEKDTIHDAIYLTNENGDFLIYYHFMVMGEDNLFAGGTAKEWLDEYKNQLFRLANVEPQTMIITDIQAENFFQKMHIVFELETQPNRSFQLTFEQCKGIRIYPMGTSNPARVYHCILNLFAPSTDIVAASIRTNSFSLEFSYKFVSLTQSDRNNGL